MKKQIKETIKSITEREERKKILEEVVKEWIKEKMKELLEEVAREERAEYCREEGDVGNGYYERGLNTLWGKIEKLRVPRTRRGGFCPFFIERYSRSGWLLEELVVAMYQGGCSTRDISRTLNILLEGRYTAGWISRVTEIIEEKIEGFRKREIKKWYPIVFVDGVVIKIRRVSVEGEVVYIAMGIDEEGHKEVLGFWIMGGEGESAGNWEEILEELKERGLKEVLVFVGDGLRGLGEAVKKVYPKAEFQSCILHKIRSSLRKVRKRDEEAVREELKKVYRSADKESFLKRWEGFKKRWEKIYPEVVKSWEGELHYLLTYLSYPEEIRSIIYTTNPLERFIKEVKRRVKVIEFFPHPPSCAKILYLVSEEMNEKYQTRRIRDFHLAREVLREMREERYGVGTEILVSSHTQNS